MGTTGDIAAGVSRSRCVAESWLLPTYIARRLSRICLIPMGILSRGRACFNLFRRKSARSLRVTLQHMAPGLSPVMFVFILINSSLLHIYNIVIRFMQTKHWVGKKNEMCTGIVWEYGAEMPRMVQGNGLMYMLPNYLKPCIGCTWEAHSITN